MASLKSLLVSAGAVFIAVVALGAAVPSISGALGPRPPTALGWFCSWFRPPYPFVVVNVIIAAIAATSRCSRRAQPGRSVLAVTVVEKMEIMEATPAAAEAFDQFKDLEGKGVVVAAAAAAGGNGRGSDGGDGDNGDCEGERKVAFRRSASARRRRVDSSEKAPVPPRPARRKAAGGDPLQGGKALRRSNENMEHVLKAILKAETGVVAAMSMTWQVKADNTNHQISLPPPPSMQKSATFENRTAQQPPVSPIKPSKDDLNHRSEAFIKKMKSFHRQELVNQYE